MISNEKAIPRSKVKSVSYLLYSIFLVAFGLWIVILSYAGPEANPPYHVPLFVEACGWFSAVFGGLAASACVKNLFNREPGLILNSVGLSDKSSGFAHGFIPWADISEFYTYKVKSQQILVIVVNNPEKYINMGNAFRRGYNRFNYKLTGSPISMSSVALKISFEELLGVCNAYLSEYGSSNQQNDSIQTS